jgi:VIT1/CCC1 family predicted Fe2+/Mn2+ transporter
MAQAARVSKTGAKGAGQTPREDRSRARIATVFGWIAGGALGLLVNYCIFLAVGESYPTTYTTFALFILGAFGGMAAADRLGPRAFKVLGIAAGVIFALFIAILLTTLLAPPTP